MSVHTNSDGKKKADFSRIVFPNMKLVKKITKLLTLISMVGSIITLVCSAYRVSSFSDYYGVPVSNISFLSIGKELLVMLCLPLLILLISRIVLWGGLVIIQRDSLQIENFVDLIGLFSLICVDCFCFYMYIKQSNLGAYDKKCFLAIAALLMIICIVFAINAYLGFRIKLSRYIPSAIIMSVAVVVVFITGVLAIIRIHDFCLPYSKSEYETVLINDQEYVVICGSEDIKLVLECESDTAGELLYLHYGKYKYISATEYDFELHSYNEVVCPRP